MCFPANADSGRRAFVRGLKHVQVREFVVDHRARDHINHSQYASIAQQVRQALVDQPARTNTKGKCLGNTYMSQVTSQKGRILGSQNCLVKVGMNSLVAGW